MSQKYQMHLEKSKALSHWIWLKVIRSSPGASDRTRASSAAFAVAFHHHGAMQLLIETEKFPSAAALVRSLFDASITALWLENCANDAELSRFLCTNQGQKTETMMRGLSKSVFFKTGELAVIKKAHWSAMSDYNHCGPRMIQRMIGEEDIGPNFDDEELIEIIRFADLWALFCLLGIARLGNDLALQSEVLSRLDAFDAK